eukprot:SAG11_NODE_714_length_7634_cov_4.848706_4_plen_60_part_00
MCYTIALILSPDKNNIRHYSGIRTESGSIFSLLIMLRAWRVVRIVHGITEVHKHPTEGG